MKKTLSVILAVIMALSVFTTAAFAVDTPIAGVEEKYSSTDFVEFTAVGEGMDNAEPAENDERYLPVSWATDDGICGEFKDGIYTAKFINVASGDRTLAVTFEKQTYTEGQWLTVYSDDEAAVVDVKEVSYFVAASSSTVEGVHEEYPANRTVTFTAKGEGMDNAEPAEGDVRYCPVYWETNEDRICGEFTEGEYTARYTNRVFGDRSLAVTFEKQVYKDGEWVAVCDAEGNPGVDVKEVNYYVAPTAEEEKEIIFPSQIVRYIYVLLNYLIEKIVSLIK